MVSYEAILDDVTGFVQTLPVSKEEQLSLRRLTLLWLYIDPPAEANEDAWAQHLEETFSNVVQEKYPERAQRLVTEALRRYSADVRALQGGGSAWDRFDVGKVLEEFKKVPAEVGKAAASLYGKLKAWWGKNKGDGEESDKNKEVSSGQPKKKEEKKEEDKPDEKKKAENNPAPKVGQPSQTPEPKPKPLEEGKKEEDKQRPKQPEKPPLMALMETRKRTADVQAAQLNALGATATGVSASRLTADIRGVQMNALNATCTGASASALTADVHGWQANVGNVSVQGASLSLGHADLGPGVDAFNFSISGPSASIGVRFGKVSFGNVSIGFGFCLDLNPLNSFNFGCGGGGGGAQGSGNGGNMGNGGESGNTGNGGNRSGVMAKFERLQTQLQNRFANHHYAIGAPGSQNRVDHYKNGVLQGARCATKQMPTGSGALGWQDFQPGDHVVEQCLFYQHHLVISKDFGNGYFEVIEYLGKGKPGSTPTGLISKQVRDVSTGRVVQRPLNPNGALARANADVGKTSYNLISNNCEHNARRWVEGVMHCTQVALPDPTVPRGPNQFAPIPRGARPPWATGAAVASSASPTPSPAPPLPASPMSCASAATTASMAAATTPSSSSSASSSSSDAGFPTVADIPRTLEEHLSQPGSKMTAFLHPDGGSELLCHIRYESPTQVGLTWTKRGSPTVLSRERRNRNEIVGAIEALQSEDSDIRADAIRTLDPPMDGDIPLDCEYNDGSFSGDANFLNGSSNSNSSSNNNNNGSNNSSSSNNNNGGNNNSSSSSSSSSANPNLPTGRGRTNATDDLDPTLLKLVKELSDAEGIVSEADLQRFLASADGQAASEDAVLMATGEGQDEMDSDEEKELCDFCKRQGKACCMRCLLGKGSKKVQRISGNIHGFQ
eukprot:CAMPEP_0206441578 /NCGR_PEP_ID=MMETSP0324_2-20121206/13357_1 /ASSEMBLY_ACC=CAM_ASM_000836 /TAXON_ID=2866 /ORGANISM="Crypthecodinium cohnii, Strain Seligo" /LENGTH=896 /DNA_ID=CAMNT_0053909351 /DNA_START=69 /DNA_END=2759 /DNA_ORIENTATION=-